MALRTTRRSTAASAADTGVTVQADPLQDKAKLGSGNAAKQRSTRQPRTSPNTSRKRKQEDDEVQVKPDDDQQGADRDELKSPGNSRKSKKKKGRGSASDAAPHEVGAHMADKWAEVRDAQRDEEPSAKSQRAKNNPYGLSPGESPFPSYQHPTPAECHEVRRILAKAHGDVAAPKTIPTPSLNSSGCGEVPSVLDALIRTRLSAATNNSNSSRAFRGLVETFGIIKDGVGKGSVDWNKVRQAPLKEVFEAIKSGGLADVKSRDIQKILNMVHEENQQRRAELSHGKQEDAEEPAEEKREEIEKASSNVISLDHLHLLDNDAAFNKLLNYPGVGPKTASCVLLFCMQRPSFAVDTHVFRLTKWLGWTPTDSQARSMAKRGESKSGQVTRNSTYAHLDVRIPDELKYPLHYLLIKHGKNCGWCSAKAGKDRKVGTCPLAGLMKGKGRSKGLAKGSNDVDDGAEGAGSEDDGASVKSEAVDED